MLKSDLYLYNCQYVYVIVTNDNQLVDDNVFYNYSCAEFAMNKMSNIDNLSIKQLLINDRPSAGIRLC